MIVRSLCLDILSTNVSLSDTTLYFCKGTNIYNCNINNSNDCNLIGFQCDNNITACLITADALKMNYLFLLDCKLKAYMYDLNDNYCIQTIEPLTQPGDEIFSYVDSNSFLYITTNATVIQYDLRNFVAQILPIKASRTSKTLASTENDILLDIKKRSIIVKYLTSGITIFKIKSFSKIVNCDMSYSRKEIAYSDKFGIIHIVNFNDTNKLVPQTLKWHQESISCLKYISNGEQLISGGKEGVLIFWNRITGKHDFCPRFEGKIKSFVLSAQENWIALLLANNKITIINVGSFSIVTTMNELFYNPNVTKIHKNQHSISKNCYFINESVIQVCSMNQMKCLTTFKVDQRTSVYSINAFNKSEETRSVTTFEASYDENAIVLCEKIQSCEKVTLQRAKIFLKNNQTNNYEFITAYDAPFNFFKVIYVNSESEKANLGIYIFALISQSGEILALKVHNKKISIEFQTIIDLKEIIDVYASCNTKGAVYMLSPKGISSYKIVGRGIIYLSSFKPEGSLEGFQKLLKHKEFFVLSSNNHFKLCTEKEVLYDENNLKIKSFKINAMSEKIYMIIEESLENDQIMNIVVSLETTRQIFKHELMSKKNLVDIQFLDENSILLVDSTGEFIYVGDASNDWQQSEKSELNNDNRSTEFLEEEPDLSTNANEKLYENLAKLHNHIFNMTKVKRGKMFSFSDKSHLLPDVHSIVSQILSNDQLLDKQI